jgi:hypothetical protein
MGQAEIDLGILTVETIVERIMPAAGPGRRTNYNR